MNTCPVKKTSFRVKTPTLSRNKSIVKTFDSKMIKALRTMSPKVQTINIPKVSESRIKSKIKETTIIKFPLENI